MTEAAGTDEIDIGPIDYLVVEYPDGRPSGEALPHLVDLVDRGIVRLLDLALVVKDADGSHHGVTLSDLAGVPELAVFDGVVSGILDEDDLAETAAVIEPGAAAAIIVYENAWAAPFAAALRRNGAQVVSTGRIPAQDLVDALAVLDD